MYTAGIDLGSATGKCVIMKDNKVVGSCIKPSQAHPDEMANRVITGALEDAGISSVEEISNIFTTGYGRLNISFAAENMSEIACHAKGAHWMVPEVRTIIDIGGQDSKLISVKEDGMVDDFTMNDKCAAGTGRFFEGVARGLGLELEDISAIENQGDDPCPISNQCSVFAESEVITLVNEGYDFKNIISGVNTSVARRMRGMSRKVGVIEGVMMTGGCSKNRGLVMAIGKILKIDMIEAPMDPQLAGAIGAALYAKIRLDKESAAA